MKYSVELPKRSDEREGFYATPRSLFLRQIEKGRNPLLFKSQSGFLFIAIIRIGKIF